MPRIASFLYPGIEPDECKAACAVRDLADSIQFLCYARDAVGIPPATVKALHRAYRVLKPITEFYFGDNSPLNWEPPTTKFQPKAKERNSV